MLLSMVVQQAIHEHHTPGCTDAVVYGGAASR